MQPTGFSPGLLACPACGQIQQLPPQVPSRCRLACVRCHGALPLGRRSHASLIYALLALACAPAALGLPLVHLERLGQSHASSLLGAVAELAQHGQWLLALVIFVFSVVLPLAKLLGLAVLLTPSWWQGLGQAKRQRWLYQGVEIAGRWGMLDVLLAALLIALVKLGQLVSLNPGPGLLAFALLVVLSILASVSLHPYHLWDQHDVL